ncbi:hypothetical protein BJ986_002288 [Phycicoccus badiiscoriae]|uniref:Uncharacterized protein n=1 Tax=Pedococcus badiiscoriae TaxID=642776 RepID=A0A852WJJ6_9MICO|nr:hypothetical protein [Pedococcus badiiscoriae]NYG07801.1 hypothetical protein [Pedococcus badiiscoriae]
MRIWLFRLLALVAALGWLVWPGFALIDLSVTWDPAWSRVLEAGLGIFVGGFLGVPLAVAAVRGRLTSSTRFVILTAILSAIVGATAGREPELWPGVALAAGELAVLEVVAWWSRRGAGNHSWAPGPVAPAAPLIAVTILGAGPLLAYANHMCALNREELPVADITANVDHYALQGGLALGLVILTLCAALLPEVRRYMGVTAAAGAFYLGLVSLAAHPIPGSLDPPWSLATMVWAVLVTVAVTMTRRATAPPGRTRPDARND